MRNSSLARSFAAMLLAAFAFGIAAHAVGIRARGLRPPDGSIAFVDRSGIPLGTFLSSDQRQQMAVPIDRISPQFIAAVVAAEDARFYRHGAVDARSLARAVWQNARCSCIRSGASTITMQLARMQFSLPDSLHGKLLQLWYAWRIEIGTDKRSILSAYANEVAMGGNVYGVEAASRIYFGIPASDLDIAQAALLAGIPNDPVGLDPRAHWAAARRRQRYVIARMFETDAITRKEADAARREQLHLSSPGDELRAAQ
ncbi:MAG: transglycosylase domain-containing protein, partial [Candidatus Eremiobacteraeota bacterium]|nr:transglycosylase domain-containing protein [Candidatus Eremiobacteraeota bacterium]